MKKGFLLFLLGTAVFAALFRFTPLGFLLSSLAGIAVMMAAHYTVKAVRTAASSGGNTGERQAAANAETVAAEGMKKMRAISGSARLIRSNAVAGQIREICRTGARIFEYLGKHPEDMGKARQFVNYYVDATKNIVDQYVELSGKKDMTQEIETALGKVEGMLSSIGDTYRRQLAHLYEDDLLDLNAEITLLKKTMELEK